MLPADRFPHVEVTSRAELREWLVAHHEQTGSVWLRTWTSWSPRTWRWPWRSDRGPGRSSTPSRLAAQGKRVPGSG